jgi:hypothetical protein
VDSVVVVDDNVKDCVRPLCIFINLYDNFDGLSFDNGGKSFENAVVGMRIASRARKEDQLSVGPFHFVHYLLELLNDFLRFLLLMVG